MVGVKRVGIGLILSLLAVRALAIENISVSGFFGSKAVLEIDGKRRVLMTGERSPEGVTLIAVAGQTAIIEYDCKREKLVMGSEISNTYAAPAIKEERYWPDKLGLYRANGTINGQSVSFLIDTGANQIAMNSGLARRLGIDYRARGERGMASTASDVVVVYRIMLDTVQVGKITLHQVSAVVLEGSQPEEVLLGMSFLSRLDMAREGGMMVLKQKW